MRKTLVLNADGKPIKAISWQNAIRLIWLDRIYVVRTYADWQVSSPSITMDVPAVVALKRMYRFKKRPIRITLENICIRDNWKCQYCGKTCTKENATKDHIIPKSKMNSNPNTWENLVLACKRCNGLKADRTPKEAGMSLLRPPKTPKYITYTPGNPPIEWIDYLATG